MKEIPGNTMDSQENKQIMKQINPGFSLEALMTWLKCLQFGHIMQTPNSPEKSRMLGKMEGKGKGRPTQDRWTQLMK